MDIIIAGGGKVGMTMARQLAAEGHNLTIIDQNPAVLEEAVQPPGRYWSRPTSRKRNW